MVNTTAELKTYPRFYIFKGATKILKLHFLLIKKRLKLKFTHFQHHLLCFFSQFKLQYVLCIKLTVKYLILSISVEHSFSDIKIFKLKS